MNTAKVMIWTYISPREALRNKNRRHILKNIKKCNNAFFACICFM